MKTVTIERRSGLSAPEFARDHMAGEGRPVVLTDVVTAWPALARWSFDHFREQYGADLVAVCASLADNTVRMTRLSEFINHIDAPAGLRGLWLDGDTGKPLPVPADTSRAYMMGWHAFQRHPEFWRDVEPAPACIEDWTLSHDDATRGRLEELGREPWSVYVGPAGSLSELHIDFGHTHSYLVQVAGRKRAVLFGPRDLDRVAEGDPDPEHPDLAKNPGYAEATAYVGEFGPGELLFTPAGWMHHVRGLTKSITVSHNFYNSHNVEGYRAWIAAQDPTAIVPIPTP